MTATYSERIKGVATSVAVKAPVRAATTANITLSGLQTIDGVVLAAGDWVLVKNQTAPTENGIYVAAVAAWARREDFDDDRDVVKGTEVIVTDGSIAASKRYRVATSNPVVIGTSSISFSLVADVNAGVIGTDIQAYDALLQAISALGITANKIIYGTGTDTVALTDAPAVFGLGITGDATLLADLDDTDIASGEYRFDATTVGDFPDGVLASQTGRVKVERQTATEAGMRLQPSNSDKEWTRRQNTTWSGTWDQAVSITGTGTRGGMPVHGAVTWGQLALGTVGQSPVSDGTDLITGVAGLILKETGLTGLSQKDIVLPAGFTVYRLVIWDLLFGTAGGTLGLRVSTDGGSSFISTGTYRTRGNSLNPGTTTSVAMGSSTTATSVQLTGALGASAGNEVDGEILLIPGASAFVCKSSLSYEDASPTGQQAFAKGRHASASVNAIRLIPSAGLTSISYSLHGVS